MQRSSLAVIVISCALFGVGTAQTTTPPDQPVPRLHGAEKRASVAAATGKSDTSGGNPDAVGMDQAVITLKDGCKPLGDVPAAKDCMSEITRAHFEELVNALQPGMVPEARRSFANNYAKLLIYADAARALKLENSTEVRLIMQYLTDQVLAETVRRHYAMEYAHPSDQEIQAYYDKDRAKYLEATLERIIIPRVPATEGKPAPSDEEQKAAAEKVRQRWIAGEDPTKLQETAYEVAGVAGAGSPNLNMGPRRPGSLPLDQEAVFQLKAGGISQVFSDPAAYYVYKVVSVREIPLSEVKDSIVRTLEGQKLQQKLQEIGNSATPVLNEVYFGPAQMPGGMAPGAPPQAGAAPATHNPPK